MRYLVLSMLLSATLAAAQDVVGFVMSQPPTARKGAEGTATGRVTLADTHAPARGARIVLYPLSTLDGPAGVGMVSGPRISVTGLDGAYLVTHVPVGDYIVLAFAAGYIAPLAGVEMPVAVEEGIAQGENGKDAARLVEKFLREHAPVIHVSASAPGRVDFDLQRGATVTGRVQYADGAPAAQVKVTLQSSREHDPKRSVDIAGLLGALMTPQNLNTDDQGRFRVAGLAPGSYRVAATESLDANEDFGNELMESFNPGIRLPGRLTVYSGNTVHKKSAKLYELKAGDVFDGVEITLPLSGLHSIRGVATGKDGTPLNSGDLELTDTADASLVYPAKIEGGGEFHISGVPEGTYELKLTQGMLMQDGSAESPTQEEMENGNGAPHPLRAFADMNVSVVVQTTDIDNLTLTLADTALPSQQKGDTLQRTVVTPP